MVAMFGAIMPAPFAIPPTMHVHFPDGNSTATSLGLVSVVMIARAASAPPCRERRRPASATPARTFSMGRRTPMTPVEATSTSSTGQAILSATIPAVSRASRRPPAPVPAFAHPALTIDRARPASPKVLLRDDHRGRLGEVRGEDAGRGAGGVRHQEREVEAVGLDPRGHGRGPEAEGDGDALAHRRFLLTSVASGSAGPAGHLDRLHVHRDAVARERAHPLREAEEADEALGVLVVVGHALAERGEVLPVEAARGAAPDRLAPSPCRAGSAPRR